MSLLWKSYFNKPEGKLKKEMEECGVLLKSCMRQGGIFMYNKLDEVARQIVEIVNVREERQPNGFFYYKI